MVMSGELVLEPLKYAAVQQALTVANIKKGKRECALFTFHQLCQTYLRQFDHEISLVAKSRNELCPKVARLSIQLLLCIIKRSDS